MKTIAGIILLLVVTLLPITSTAQPPGSDAPGTWEQRIVTVENIQRLYYLYLPDHYERFRERPLIVNLHGSIDVSGLDSVGQRPEVFMFGRQYTPSFLDTSRASMMWKVAEEEKVLVVCPLSRTSPAWSWFDPTGNLEYMDAILDDVQGAYGQYVDFDRVYATGFSAGGGMTHRLAYYGGTRFAAFGPMYYPMNTALYPLDPPEILPRGLIQVANRYDPTVDVPYTEPSDSITILQTVAKWRDWCGIHFQDGQLRPAPIDTVMFVYLDGSDLAPDKPVIEFVTLFQSEGAFVHSYPKYRTHGFQANKRLWEFLERFSLSGTDTRELLPDERQIASVPLTEQHTGITLSAYPNPFNAVTTLSVNLPEAADLRVQVFDVRGRLVTTVTDGRAEAGRHTLTLAGHNLASGTYFLCANAGEWSASQRILLLK
ncbi:T9SS type A sorting domain-containing protein [bacterium]|nr:T9SS type A sorting domain-containing protein [bacterium]